jgi:RHS repeat-associated protein
MKKETDPTLHFYQGGQLHTVIGATTRRTVFRHHDQPLAEQHDTGPSAVKLLPADTQGSILHAQTEQGVHPLSYTAFGHSSIRDALGILTQFNGEVRDTATGCYLLGNGYRAYNPITMRFNSPDSLSPFGAGGMNAFAYCAGDPVNRTDPTGHMYHQGTSRPYPGLQNMVKLKDPVASMRPVSLPPAKVPKPIARLSHSWRKIAEKKEWLLHDDEKRMVEIGNFVASRRLGFGHNAVDELKAEVAYFINKRITNPDEKIPYHVISKEARSAAKKLGRRLTESLKIEQTDEINHIRTQQRPSQF